MNSLLGRRTPFNDEYPSCGEARAALLVYTPGFSPDEVTTRLGIQPSQVRKLGEAIQNSSGRTRIAKSSFWELSSEGQVDSLDMRRHIDWLTDLLTPRATELLGLQEVPGVVMALTCVWYSRSGHGGPVLWPEQMRALADLNLECSFDIYFLDDEPNFVKLR